MAITSPAERTVRRDSGADKEQMVDTAGGATMRQDEHRFTSKSDLTGQRRVDPLGDTHGCSNECFEYGGRPKWVAPSRRRLSSAWSVQLSPPETLNLEWPTAVTPQNPCLGWGARVWWG